MGVEPGLRAPGIPGARCQGARAQGCPAGKTTDNMWLQQAKHGKRWHVGINRVGSRHWCSWVLQLCNHTCFLRHQVTSQQPASRQVRSGCSPRAGRWRRWSWPLPWPAASCRCRARHTGSRPAVAWEWGQVEGCEAGVERFEVGTRSRNAARLSSAGAVQQGPHAGAPSQSVPLGPP